MLVRAAARGGARRRGRWLASGRVGNEGCVCCGGTRFEQRPVLWPALVEGWGLSAAEAAAVERQQGVVCLKCGANLQSMALALSIKGVLGLRGRFRTLALRRPCLQVLEVNQAGDLHRHLRRLPRHELASYPAVDFQRLPMADDTYDLVVHSEVLEHVEDPVRALREAHRVLKPGGFTCYTVPAVMTRLTGSTAGHPPTYHGSPEETGEGLRVRTEYGADLWAQAVEAGFRDVRLTPACFPSAIAVAAGKEPRRRSWRRRGLRRR
jgi:SAM-dependent methyltransferase